MTQTTAPAPEPTLVLPQTPRIPAGWRIIAGKEFADHLLSLRFLLLLLMLGVLGVGTIYTVANSIQSAASQVSGARGIFLLLFTVNPSTSIAQSLPPFVQLVGFLGPLVGIAFGFNAINAERSDGTLPRLLSQPIHRDDVINGKFVAGLGIIALILGAVIVLLSAVGMLRLGLVPSGDDALRLFTWYLMTVVYVGFWLALSMLCSVLFKNSGTAFFAVLAVWLVLTFFGSTIVDAVSGIIAPVPTGATFQAQLDHAVWQQNLARLTPTKLYSEMGQIILDPRVQTVDITGLVQLQTNQRAIATVLPYTQSLLIAWQQLFGLVAMTVVCFAATYIAFMRQEVRA
ncbi:MAG: ABC transporter permease [Chloroflexota bacterium]